MIVVIELAHVLLRRVGACMERVAEAHARGGSIHAVDEAQIGRFRLVIAEEEIKLRIDMICQSRARLLHIAQVGARRAVELRRYDICLGKAVQMPPLVVIVVDAEALVACAHTVLTLSEIAEADMRRIARALLRDDVHDAAHRLAAVEDGSRPFDDLDALDLIGRDLVKVVLAAP